MYKRQDVFRKLSQEEIEAENQSSSAVEEETLDEDNEMIMKHRPYILPY